MVNSYMRNINKTEIKRLLMVVGYESVSSEFDMAISRAQKIVNRYHRIIESLHSYYQENQIYSDLGKPSFSKLFVSTDVLNNATLFHFNTWKCLQRELFEIYHRNELNRYPHHTLARLLNPNDEIFLSSVESGALPLGEEIGLIAIQRLKKIMLSGSPKMKSTASRAINTVMGFHKEGILSFDYEALIFEVAKLILYPLIFDDQKKTFHQKNIFLGTARAVDAVLKKFGMSQGIGLGCPEEQYSWGLNRAWLQIAASMGYSFQLVERHYPQMEVAICSGNVVAVIEFLANQIRMPEITSQYTRRDSPTATPQEILSLIDGGGCIGVKDSETGILLLKRKSSFSIREAFSAGISRANSAPRSGGFFALPPCKISVEMTPPSDGSSSDYRNSPAMQNLPCEEVVDPSRDDSYQEDVTLPEDLLSIPPSFPDRKLF